MALVLFDLNGTLLDPGPRKDAIQAGVRLAMIHQLGGEFRPLAELIQAAGGEVPDAMPPFPTSPRGSTGSPLTATGSRSSPTARGRRATGICSRPACGTASNA
jgi:hypothetical protein